MAFKPDQRTIDADDATSRSPGTPTAPEPGRYEIDISASAVTFRTRHLFGALPRHDRGGAVRTQLIAASAGIPAGQVEHRAALAANQTRGADHASGRHPAARRRPH
jgi:hypothetical protein